MLALMLCFCFRNGEDWADISLQSHESYHDDAKAVEQLRFMICAGDPLPHGEISRQGSNHTAFFGIRSICRYLSYPYCFLLPIITSLQASLIITMAGTKTMNTYG